MISARKSALFEQRLIPTEGNDVLHAKLMHPKPPAYPKRLVLIPPLIGAGAAQPLIIFRNLTRRGSILLSFEYRGHPRSTGTFSLDGTIVDTRYALAWASNYARRHGLPLHGFATCYGLVTLAAQFAGPGPACRLWSLCTVSGLFRLDQILRFEDFAPVFARHLGVDLSVPALLDRIARQAFDFNGDAFRNALREHLARLFPELRVERDLFEELRYERVDIPRTLLELSRAQYLHGVRVPPEVPCSVFFGRNDDLLSLDTPQGREDYCRQVLTIMPHAELYECEIDHYGRGQDHDPVIDKLADVFEQCEVRAVRLLPAAPAPSLQETLL